MPGRGSEILARQFTHVEFSGNLDSEATMNRYSYSGYNIFTERISSIIKFIGHNLINYFFILIVK